MNKKLMIIGGCALAWLAIAGHNHPSVSAATFNERFGEWPSQKIDEVTSDQTYKVMAALTFYKMQCGGSFGPNTQKVYDMLSHLHSTDEVAINAAVMNVYSQFQKVGKETWCSNVSKAVEK